MTSQTTAAGARTEQWERSGGTITCAGRYVAVFGAPSNRDSEDLARADLAVIAVNSHGDFQHTLSQIGSGKLTAEECAALARAALAKTGGA